MKNIYESPELQIINVSAADVVATSDPAVADIDWDLD